MARRVIRSARMPKHWHGITAGEIHLVGTGTQIVGAFSGVATTPYTVLRMLGEYIIVPTSAPTAADAVLISSAIGVVSDDAVAVGATAMPDPLSDVEYPWLYWASHPFHFSSTSVDPSQAGGSVRVKFDMKSMRKIKPRESLVWVFEYFDVAGTPPMSVFAGDLRFLVAE